MPTKSTVQSSKLKTRSDMLAAEVTALQAQIDAKQAKIDFLANLPEDDYANGATVIFEKKFATGGIVYTYAAVKGGNFWYLSGDTSRRSWESLLEYLYYNIADGGFIRVYFVSEITEVC